MIIIVKEKRILTVRLAGGLLSLAIVLEMIVSFRKLSIQKDIRFPEKVYSGSNGFLMTAL